MADHVAAILAAWQAECPELDVSPVGVFGRVSRIERYKSQALRPLFRAHRIDGGDYDVLAALRRSGPPYRLTPTELYRSMLVTSAAMTQRLDRLEQRKLIRRQPAPDDRRSVHVQLTEKGRTLVDKAHTQLLAAEAGLLDGLTPAQQTTLAQLLARLTEHLEDRFEAAPPKR